MNMILWSYNKPLSSFTSVHIDIYWPENYYVLCYHNFRDSKYQCSPLKQMIIVQYQNNRSRALLGSASFLFWGGGLRETEDVCDDGCTRDVLHAFSPILIDCGGIGHTICWYGSGTTWYFSQQDTPSKNIPNQYWHQCWHGCVVGYRNHFRSPVTALWV